ncbi:MAG TPA: tetratricopeptide repeat protein [Cellvibrio sp.]|nr:tetratricopeptide repeat protein [Cellvibrio sp.]
MNSVDINLENAQQFLIEESFKRPVVVDFWAEWCLPCKNLTAILEKLANEAADDFLLAKVDVDKWPMISAQFDVRDLPTLVIIKDGKAINGFNGAVSEQMLREMFAQYLPKPWQKPFAEAQALIAAGDYDSALPRLRLAYDESRQLPEVAYLLVECHFAVGRLDNAEQLLSAIKPADQDDRYTELLAQLELKKQAAKSPELVALEAAHSAEPDNLEVSFQLALQYERESLYRQALELLLALLRKDRNFASGLAKKTLTGILTALGKGDPLAIEFQRKLFTLLY